MMLSCNQVPKENSIDQTDTVITTSAMQEIKVAQEIHPDSIEKVIPIGEEVAADKTPYSDEINFAKYLARPEKRQSNAPINWASNPDAKTFKTRIINAYRDYEVSFAGHYVLSTFGCGGGCIMGFMVDVRDGVIYDLPLGEENSCFFAEQRAVCERTSKLFISGVCKENPEAKKLFYLAFLWDEENKKFNPIKEEKFLK